MADSNARAPLGPPAQVPMSPVSMPDSGSPGVAIRDVQSGEDVLAYIQRVRGRFDHRLYQQLVGAANEHKEGDAAIGVAAADERSRQHARTLLGRTRIRDLLAHPLYEDRQYALILDTLDPAAAAATRDWTLDELKAFLLDVGEDQIKAISPGLASDIIACVVKLMTNDELCAIGSKVFNPLPGSQLGARGYLGARIQPNSPTDHVDDIRWQVFAGWSFAVGDVVLGTNPVSSAPQSVAAVERTLADVLQTFGLTEVMPHCVLAHIDIQAEVEAREPGCTALWFQSLGSTEAANRTFDLTLDKLLAHADQRTGKYGLYFETGQGADATNGHDHGFDMVVHEARKYGLARVLTQRVARAQEAAGRPPAPWVHVNDVAGFIGPEVFRSREQLVRCCLEDIVMGKLHGLMIGLDVCSTLHMDVSLDDLDWCLERIVPACPGYLMALPTKNDPMLSYLTTAFQDHVRLREQLGLRVNDAMWTFFQQELGVIDAQGRPTERFGQPAWVYLAYCRRKGDARAEAEILAEAGQQIAAVQRRGVPLASGHGVRAWDPDPALDREIRVLYDDAKRGLWSELDPAFVASIPAAVRLRTRSADRRDYILHPDSGEQLDAASESTLAALRERRHERPVGQWNVQLLVSDGLDARAIMDEDHLLPYLAALRARLAAQGYRVAPEHLVLTAGRVRAGYRAGELLFAGAAGSRAIIHVIGERPGSGHHSFSAYVTALPGSEWARTGTADHNLTRVVSGIADTALRPELAAEETARILAELMVAT